MNKLGYFLILAMVLAALGAADLKAAEAVHWRADYEAACTESRQTGHPMLVHFYGDHCRSCRQMDQQVFTRQDVADAVDATFVPLKIDSTANTALAKRLGVRAIPCDIILDTEGRILYRREGGISGDQYLGYIHLVARYEANKSQQSLQIAQSMTSIPTAHIAQVQLPVASPFDPIPAAPPAVVPPPPPPPQPEIATIPSAQVPFPVTAATAPPIATAMIPSIPTAQPAIPASDVATVSASVVEIPLGLEGYCPVELGLNERWVPGNPLYYAMFRGQIYRFSTEEALTMFHQDPSRFAPIAGGDDIVLMVDRNKRQAGQRKYGAWYKDRVYLFSGRESFDIFSARPDYYADIASKYETALRSHFDKVQR